jgi:hypothetical protein
MNWSIKVMTVVAASVFLILIVFPETCSAAKGYTVWFFKMSKPIVTVDGKPIRGWLHKTHDGRVVFTRNDTDKPETYDLVFTDNGNGQVLS